MQNPMGSEVISRRGHVAHRATFRSNSIANATPTFHARNIGILGEFMSALFGVFTGETGVCVQIFDLGPSCVHGLYRWGGMWFNGRDGYVRDLGVDAVIARIPLSSFIGVRGVQSSGVE